MAAPPSRHTWSNGCAPRPARRCTPAWHRFRPGHRCALRRHDESMMHETLSYGTAHNAQLPGWPAAGKTGTSQDFRDAWFIGYTGHLVTGVWLGNDDSRRPARRPAADCRWRLEPVHEGRASRRRAGFPAGPWRRRVDGARSAAACCRWCGRFTPAAFRRWPARSLAARSSVRQTVRAVKFPTRHCRA